MKKKTNNGTNRVTCVQLSQRKFKKTLARKRSTFTNWRVHRTHPMVKRRSYARSGSYRAEYHMTEFSMQRIALSSIGVERATGPAKVHCYVAECSDAVHRIGEVVNVQRAHSARVTMGDFHCAPYPVVQLWSFYVPHSVCFYLAKRSALQSSYLCHIEEVDPGSGASHDPMATSWISKAHTPYGQARSGVERAADPSDHGGVQYGNGCNVTNGGL